MCSSTLSLTSALDGGGWLIPRSRSFDPGKETRYPLCRRLFWPQGWSGRVRNVWKRYGEEEISYFHRGSNSAPSKPQTSPYTNYAIPAPK